MPAGLTGVNIWSLTVQGTNLFAGTDSGVWLSTNKGTSWTNVNSGFGNNDVHVHSIPLSGPNLFAGTWGGGVWRRPLSEMTRVGLRSSDQPEEYQLSQNYPNPFNPGTTISYSISRLGHTKLVVYDCLGRIVATLLDEQQSAGHYSIQFNASNLSSSVYLYKLTSANYTSWRKMSLVK